MEFGRWSGRFENFVRFVNNQLLLRAEVNLHTFQLHLDSDSYLNWSDARMWIGYAVRHIIMLTREHTSARSTLSILGYSPTPVLKS